MTAIAIVTLLSGILVFLLSLPLIFRKVPMNRSYGIRIPSAFESEQRWYDINAYGGRRLAAWSWLITVTGVAGFFVSPEQRDNYILVSVAVTFVTVAIPALQVCLWSCKK